MIWKTFARNLLRVLDVVLLPFTALSLLWLRAFRFGGAAPDAVDSPRLPAPRRLSAA
jgi:hypothetical protein